jgi:hypothetical protein
MSYCSIFLAILLTVYAQLALKRQVIKAGALLEKINFLVHFTAVRLTDE